MTSATVGGATTAYGYDADQQRRFRVGAAGTEYFVHGPGFVPLAEYTEANGTLAWQRDYIYAGSRLIVSVASTTGSDPTHTFTDDPLVAGTTPVKAVHLTELRTAVNDARAVYGLPAAAWTDPTVTPGGTMVRAVHVTELRDALNAAYVAAGATSPTYTDPTLTPQQTPIRAAHLQELRAAVRALPAPSATGVSYYHLDALGSVRAVTDDAGTVLGRHDYPPFGEEYEPEDGADARRFTGKERDEETELDYFSARYYVQRQGRFTSADDPSYMDPFDPQSMNRYAYALNNPVLYIDPDGHQAVIRRTYEFEDPSQLYIVDRQRPTFDRQPRLPDRLQTGHVAHGRIPRDQWTLEVSGGGGDQPIAALGNRVEALRFENDRCGEIRRHEMAGREQLFRPAREASRGGDVPQSDRL